MWFVAVLFCLMRKKFSFVKILVKKVYADKSLRNRRRQWKLKHLDVEDVASVNSTIERLVLSISSSMNFIFELISCLLNLSIERFNKQLIKWTMRTPKIFLK